MRKLLAVVFGLFFFGSSLGICGEIDIRNLKLGDLMPPFEFKRSTPILPGEERSDVSISIQIEDDEIGSYKDKLQDAFEQLDKFQGRY